MTAATLSDDRLDDLEGSFVLTGPAALPQPTPSRTQALVRALAAPLLIAVILQNIGNLVLHAVLGRFLTADQYGALGTVLSLMVMLTVPLSALQAAASKSSSAGPAERATQRRSVRSIALVSVVAAIPVAVAAPLLVSAFHLPTLLDALVLGPFVGISIALAVVRGRLLGLDQKSGIRAVAATFVISTVVRVGLALALLGVMGTSSAILATLIGEALALVYGVRALPRVTAASVHPVGEHPWLRWGDVGWSGLAIGGLFLFTTVDLFLARHFLPGDASGAYVAAATIGKTLLALPAAAMAAAYPRLVAAGRGRGRVSEVRRTGLVVVGLAMLATIVVAAVPGLVLHGLYGSSFDGSASLVRLLAIVAGTSSIVSVVTYALLAVGSKGSLLPWVGALVQFVAIGIWHATPLQIGTASACALIVTVVICMLALVIDIRTRARGVHTA
jgi:O-antigen/teichoic acid export membrane protein